MVMVSQNACDMLEIFPEKEKVGNFYAHNLSNKILKN